MEGERNIFISFPDGILVIPDETEAEITAWCGGLSYGY